MAVLLLRVFYASTKQLAPGIWLAHRHTANRPVAVHLVTGRFHQPLDVPPKFCGLFSVFSDKP
jgi:hypothetical protein